MFSWAWTKFQFGPWVKHFHELMLSPQSHLLWLWLRTGCTSLCTSLCTPALAPLSLAAAPAFSPHSEGRKDAVCAQATASQFPLEVNLNQTSCPSFHSFITDDWVSSFFWGHKSGLFCLEQCICCPIQPLWNPLTKTALLKLRYVGFSVQLLWSKRIFHFPCTGCKEFYISRSGEAGRR